MSGGELSSVGRAQALPQARGTTREAAGGGTRQKSKSWAHDSWAHDLLTIVLCGRLTFVAAPSFLVLFLVRSNTHSNTRACVCLLSQGASCACGANSCTGSNKSDNRPAGERRMGRRRRGGRRIRGCVNASRNHRGQGISKRATSVPLEAPDLIEPCHCCGCRGAVRERRNAFGHQRGSRRTLRKVASKRRRQLQVLLLVCAGAGMRVAATVLAILVPLLVAILVPLLVGAPQHAYGIHTPRPCAIRTVAVSDESLVTAATRRYKDAARFCTRALAFSTFSI